MTSEDIKQHFTTTKDYLVGGGSLGLLVLLKGVYEMYLLFYRSIVCAREAGGWGMRGEQGIIQCCGGGGGGSQMFMIDQPQCDRLRRKIIVHAPTPVRHVIQLSLWPG